MQALLLMLAKEAMNNSEELDALRRQFIKFDVDGDGSVRLLIPRADS